VQIKVQKSCQVLIKVVLVDTKSGPQKHMQVQHQIKITNSPNVVFLLDFQDITFKTKW